MRAAQMGWPEESTLVRPQAQILPHYMYADYGPKGVQGGERKATLLASWVTTLPKKFPFDEA